MSNLDHILTPGGTCPWFSLTQMVRIRVSRLQTRMVCKSRRDTMGERFLGSSEPLACSLLMIGWEQTLHPVEICSKVCVSHWQNINEKEF